MPLQSFHNWKEQYERVLRWHERVKEFDNVDCPSQGDLDYLLAFFMNCYHLKDWLEAGSVVSSKELEHLFNTDQYLCICRTICNGVKHFQIDRRPIVDGKFGFGLRARTETIDASPFLDDSPAYLYTIFVDGKLETIYNFGLVEWANGCVNAWSGFLQSQGLLAQS